MLSTAHPPSLSPFLARFFDPSFVRSLFPCCWFFFFPGLLSDAASPCHAVCAQFLVTMLVSILVSALPVLLSDDASALWRLVSLLAPLGHAWFWMLRSSFGALSPLSVPFLSPSCLLLVSFLSPSYLRLVPLICCSAIGCCSRLPTVVDARRPDLPFCAVGSSPFRCLFLSSFVSLLVFHFVSPLVSLFVSLYYLFVFLLVFLLSSASCLPCCSSCRPSCLLSCLLLGTGKEGGGSSSSRDQARAPQRGNHQQKAWKQGGSSRQEHRNAATTKAGATNLGGRQCEKSATAPFGFDRPQRNAALSFARATTCNRQIGACLGMTLIMNKTPRLSATARVVASSLAGSTTNPAAAAETVSSRLHRRWMTPI